MSDVNYELDKEQFEIDADDAELLNGLRESACNFWRMYYDWPKRDQDEALFCALAAVEEMERYISKEARASGIAAEYNPHRVQWVRSTLRRNFAQRYRTMHERFGKGALIDCMLELGAPKGKTMRSLQKWFQGVPKDDSRNISITSLKHAYNFYLNTRLWVYEGYNMMIANYTKYIKALDIEYDKNNFYVYEGRRRDGIESDKKTYEAFFQVFRDVDEDMKETQKGREWFENEIKKYMDIE